MVLHLGLLCLVCFCFVPTFCPYMWICFCFCSCFLPPHVFCSCFLPPPFASTFVLLLLFASTFCLHICFAPAFCPYLLPPHLFCSCFLPLPFAPTFVLPLPFASTFGSTFRGIYWGELLCPTLGHKYIYIANSLISNCCLLGIRHDAGKFVPIYHGRESENPYVSMNISIYDK